MPFGSLSAAATALSFRKKRKERKEKTTPFGVNLMRSQVLYQAAQSVELYASG